MSNPKFSLNKYMHPRNIYKVKKPDFEYLASKYEDFQFVLSREINNKLKIDFKNPDALRALTCTLLREDFGIHISIPNNRLIPTVPQRLNYILWIEDIFTINDTGRETLNGIDIGTGSSCIYPLLGAKLHGWNFLASELDVENCISAKSNVSANGFDDKIKVVPIDEGQMLISLIEENAAPEMCFDFCMVNPPFFASSSEAVSVHASSREFSAADIEKDVEGGEVAFITRLIEDSIQLRGRVKVYTTMLGIKKSVNKLKAVLRSHNITNMSSSEFCQGRTMRWCLAWSFNSNVKWPPSYFKENRHRKPQKPLTYAIPCQQLMCLSPGDDTIFALSKRVLDLLDELQMDHSVLENRPSVAFAVEATAHENTWSNQRRKRRERMRDAFHSNSAITTAASGLTASPDNADMDSTPELTTPQTPTSPSNKRKHADISEGGYEEFGDLSPEAKRPKPHNGDGASLECTDSMDAIESDQINTSHSAQSSTAREEPDFVIKFELSLRRASHDLNSVTLELIWLEGRDRDSLHQVLQFFKNRLK